MENSVRKREWVKTAAIIFLAVLLVLTFFSKTIMNASLPEVAAQQAASGAINARIRGSGTVEASEVYNVTIKQTRKVASVLVKTGQEINVGDTMFVLEAEDSDELKQAETDLETLQQNYDKSLIEAGNTAAQENYDVQKAREAYNEALALYNQYTNVSATQLSSQKIAEENRLKDLQQSKTVAESTITELKNTQAYIDAKQIVTDAETELASLQKDRSSALASSSIPAGRTIGSTSSINIKIEELQRTYKNALDNYNEDFAAYYELCSGDSAAMKKNYLDDTITKLVSDKNIFYTPEEVNKCNEKYRKAYEQLYVYYYGDSAQDGIYVLQDMLKIAEIDDEIRNIKQDSEKAAKDVKEYEDRISYFEKQVTSLDTQINEQQKVIDKLSSAASAADTVKSTKQALEDLIFKQNLGDSSSVDMEASKKAIERKQAEVDKLRENADELEVKSSVAGTIASINASAGKSIGGEEQPLATINVTDRGFTVKIDVTNDQAKKVKTGDTAELVNFWGGDAVATLDQITSSQTAGNRTLVFTLTGDIQAGQNVTLSIGQKSANYDALIPLSGLREDSNGKFVYVLESKSSPLGSRYIATRVTVQELARDDKSAAVSGISSGDFIITTSNKPVEAGKQVRLADNG